MSLHFNTYSIVLLLSGLAATIVGIVLFQRKHPAIRWFALMMHASAIWAIAYSFELSSSTLTQMLFWIDVEYVGVSFIPALWIMFVIHFLSRERWLSSATPVSRTGRFRIALIFLIPTITFLMVITNAYHHLHYASLAVDTSGPFPLLAIVTGPWYTLHTIFFYFLLLLGMLLLVWHFKRFDSFYQKQTIIILAGALVPWVTNLAYLLGVRPYAHIDLTPYAFILTTLIIAFGLTRYKLFDIVPYAREKLIENLREGMIILDEQGRIIDLNVAMQKFLGYDESLIGKKLTDLLVEDTAIQHALRKQQQQLIELTIAHTAGIREYEVSVTPLMDNQKKVAGMLLAFWDITARKQQAKELKELNDLKSQLFSIIAHDLKSPMSGLNGLLKLAESGVLSEAELKDILPRLSKNADNVSTLLDNVLSWAQSQLQGSHVSPVRFDIDVLIQANILLFEKRISEKGITLHNECNPGTMVYGDQDMIDLVLRNLIGNAIKYCDAGDLITLRSETDDKFTTIVVSDTGTGMDSATLDKLFRLMAGSKAGTRSEKGTGLGLKLCKDFMEKNNGVIRVKSEVGKGSVFSIRLPNKKVL